MPATSQQENPSDDYLHGTSADEQRRLAVMNDWINEISLREMNLRPAGGGRVLDIGSGQGQLSRAIARTIGPTGRVVGVERDAEQLRLARDFAHESDEGGLVDFRSGDATDLPLGDDEWGSFDVVHTRFVLEHVADPLGVVRSMVRAATPNGGRIVLEDDDHDMLKLHPQPPGFAELWSAYQRCYELNNNDPLIGRRLVELLHAAGARPTRNTLLFFGACAGHEHWHTAVRNLIGVIRTAQQRMSSLRLIEDRAMQDAFAALDEWETRQDAAIWYAISWAEGVA
jgi:ubiquinone/menaquinone biosynthesis C-methylase UbiE